jgi:hypothetical protein
MQRGLIVLHDQQVGGVLGGDQPVGMLALAVERVGSDHGVGEVQAVQQRPELGDLIGLAVHFGPGEDTAAGVVHHGEQVDLRVAVVAAAAQGLAIDRDRPARRAGCRWRPRCRRGWLLAGQPSADGAVQGVGVDAGQHAVHCRLGGWLPGAGPRVAAGRERGQDLTGRVAGPLADGGQGPRAGQHRADRDAEHANQLVPSATPVAGSAIWARQPSRLRHWSGASAAGGASRWVAVGMGDDERAGTAVRTGHGLGYLHDRGEPCPLHIYPDPTTRPSPTRQARTIPRPWRHPLVSMKRLAPSASAWIIHLWRTEPTYGGAGRGQCCASRPYPPRP